MPLLMLSACGSGPDDSVKTFYKDVAAGDIGGATDQLDPALRQMGGAKIVASLNRLHENAVSKGGLKSIEVTGSSIQADTGSVSVRETFNNGATADETEKVRKVDGKWYVTV